MHGMAHVIVNAPIWLYYIMPLTIPNALHDVVQSPLQ
jgi:hypothetical protein